MRTLKNLIRVYGFACVSDGLVLAYVWLAVMVLRGGWFGSVGDVVFSAVLGLLAASASLVRRWRRYVKADRAIQREAERS